MTSELNEISIEGFQINISKVVGKGEDADPLHLTVGNKGVCGVFDGLGGAGAHSYNNGETLRTGASIGSQVVRDACDSFFSRILLGDEVNTEDDYLRLLKEKIVQALRATLEQYSIPTSRLKSSLIKTFPTTVALGLFDIDAGEVNITALWAGDSRVYCLTPDIGLRQLTKDDLRSNNDPMENIINDSPMSNVVQADNDFCLNVSELSVHPPAVMISATDGCFGYFTTPMHFEYALLKSLVASNSMPEWNENVSELIRDVSGDDFSMAVWCIKSTELGFDDFRQMFFDRLERLANEYIKPVQLLHDEIVTLKTTVKISDELICEKETILKQDKFRLWLKYKESYLYYK